jgi:RNA polymerase-binding transcription factor DksA
MANPASAEHEREKLLQEQAQVTDELNHLRELMRTEVDVELDEGDSEVFEREKNAALIAVLEIRMQDIQMALRSIEKGSYGTCARCGKQIEPARLEVKPDATLCLTFKQEIELLSRRTRPSRPIQW